MSQPEFSPLPSLWEFAKAIWANWGQRMSGPLSVPLVLASFWFSNHYIGVGFSLLGIACGLYAAYRIWASERSRVFELQKISRRDLQRMLHGVFMENTFILGGEGNFCARYKGKFDIQQIGKDYDKIHVRAPGSSLIHIRLQPNFHRGQSGNVFLLVRDGRGNITKFTDLYAHIPVVIGPNGDFELRLVFGDDLELDDNTGLSVELEDWTK